MEESELFFSEAKALSFEEQHSLKSQDARLVSEHKANLLELQAKKHWDLFYKRNETRFFKDRHWTIREFAELLGSEDGVKEEKVLFEIGCGVGNFIYPLVEEKLNFRIYACDLSPRAVEFVKTNPLYNSRIITAFQCNVTQESEVFENIDRGTVDVVTLIFVLSAIHPEKHCQTLRIIFQLLKPGGLLLFRDYGLYDMAQIRFKPGNKIAENFYMRQDGTRSYFFSIQSVTEMLENIGFKILANTYVHRRTINRKENINVPRIFVQVKASKP